MLPALSAAPATASTSPPAVASTTALLQVVPAFGVLAMARPAGSVSVRAMPLKATPEPLLMVTVSRVAWPMRTVLAAKLLAMVGWVTTLRRAVAAFWLLTPWVVVTPNLAIVLS